MPEYSVCIPFLSDGGERDRVFRWLVEYYRTQLPEAEVVWTREGARRDARTPVNRSRLRNLAVREAQTDWLCILDADCLLPAELVREGMRRIRDGAHLVQLAGVTWLTEATTAAVLAGDPGAFPEVVYSDPDRRRVLPPQGFAYFVPRWVFNHAGGFDERFQGWGAEDEAFRFTADTLCGPAVRMPGLAYHLWHPRTVENSRQHPHFEENRELLRRYQAARTDRPSMAMLAADNLRRRGLRRILAHTLQYLPAMLAGAERSLHELMRWLQQRGHAVTVLVDRDMAAADVVDGIRVEPRGDDPLIIYSRHDVALARHNAAAAGVRLAQQAGIPVAASVVNTWPSPHSRLIKQAALLLANSGWVANHWGAHAFLWPTITPEPYRVESPGPCVTLINLSENKGARQFVELARRLPDLPFLGVRGSYGKQVIPQDLPANVRIIDPIWDMREIYRQTRVLLMLSQYETFGRCAVEAACSGIPTIASPTPGLREALDDAGIWVGRSDIDGIARTIRELLKPQHYAAAARAARRRYDRYWRIHLLQLQAVEEQLIEISGGDIMTEVTTRVRVRVLNGTLHYHGGKFSKGETFDADQAYAQRKASEGWVEIMPATAEIAPDTAERAGGAITVEEMAAAIATLTGMSPEDAAVELREFIAELTSTPPEGETVAEDADVADKAHPQGEEAAQAGLGGIDPSLIPDDEHNTKSRRGKK